tara:strand:+ start:662 stop:1843 length:1182 start_codon:yes stop_codon:yes gene_type:complete
MAETKKAAEGFTAGPASTSGQNLLMGSTKETLRASVAQKEAIADTAGKTAGIVKEAAGVQAGAATAAGAKLGSAYDKARAGLGQAYGQASGAIETKHRNALVAARQALAQAAMKGMQRGRTTAGNIGAAGTLGKQAAATHAQIASQQATEKAQLGTQAAAAMGELGVNKAMGLGAAGTTAAGFTASGMKEEQAANLASGDALYNAIMAKAEEEGTEFFMTAQAAAQLKTDLDIMLSEISVANKTGTEEGVIQAQAYLSQLNDPMTPQDKVVFEHLFNQGMSGIAGMESGAGLWSIDDAFFLADTIGASGALQVMSNIPDYIGRLQGPDGQYLSLTPGLMQGLFNRIQATGGGLDTLGQAYYDEATGWLGFVDFGQPIPDGSIPFTTGEYYGAA